MTSTVLRPLTSSRSRTVRWFIRQTITSLSSLAWFIAVRCFRVSVIQAASAQLAIVFLTQAANLAGWPQCVGLRAVRDEKADDGSFDHNDISVIMKPDAAAASIIESPALQLNQSDRDPRFGNDRIEACLSKFLAVTEPKLLESLPSAHIPQPYQIALQQWTACSLTGDVSIAKHPEVLHLYALTLSLPNTPLQAVWQIINDTEARSRWDSASAGARTVAKFDSTEAQSSLIHMKTKGRFPVKATDMTMLAVNARINDHKFVRAMTSVVDASIPVAIDFDRIRIDIAGFVLEDSLDGGCKVTQILDLSALGSWLPSRVMTAITQTALPQSLLRLGALAKLHTSDMSTHIGRASLPPMIDRTKVVAASPSSVKSSSTYLALNNEMRKIIARLDRLESAGIYARCNVGATTLQGRVQSRSLFASVLNAFSSPGSAATWVAFVAVFVLRWVRRCGR